MNESIGWRSIVRREWLLVLAAVIVAVAAAGAVSLAFRPKAVATAQVLCEQRLLAVNAGVPTADEAVSSMHTHGANVSVASRSGVTPTQVAAELRVAAVSAPLYGVGITVTSADAVEAQRIAVAAVSEVEKRARALDATEIGRYRARAALDTQALGVIQPAAVASPANVDFAFKLWTVGVASSDDSATVATLQDAYGIVGNVTVTRPSRVSATLQNLFAAVAVGLLVGFGLAVVRERLLS